MSEIVRVASKEDLAALALLERSSFSSPWSKSALLEEWTLGSRGLWPRLHVLEIDGRIVAYCATLLVLDELQLFRIAVAPEARRRGYAKKLLEAVLALAKDAEVCTLEVREGNTAARAFYERFGFQEVGRRRAYYSDTGEDAILLDLRIIG